MPAGLTVETKAIGRGTIDPTITLYTFGKPAESGSMITLQCISEPDLSLVAGHFEIPHALLSARIIDRPFPIIGAATQFLIRHHSVARQVRGALSRSEE